MIQRRKIAAFLLAAVFTTGAVVSPFAHYSYMLLADWGGQDGGSMHHTMSGHETHGPHLNSPTSSSTCNYWELVGTLLSIQPEASESPFPVQEPELLDELGHEQFAGLLVDASLSIRGPPVL